MYSDKWLTDLSNKRTSVEELKSSLIYCYYWIDKDNNKLGISINFEYAEDSHIEILYENLLKLSKILFEITNKKEILESLKEFFKSKDTAKKEELKEFKNLLTDNNIEYKIINFY